MFLFYKNENNIIFLINKSRNLVLKKNFFENSSRRLIFEKNYIDCSKRKVLMRCMTELLPFKKDYRKKILKDYSKAFDFVKNRSVQEEW